MKFTEFPKMGRFSREAIITEKIDGTNASIFIQNESLEEFKNQPDVIAISKDGDYTMRAGSRTKWITPNNDNAGFARWVVANAEELFKLGEGHHFGEWWGSGIQRGYGLQKGEKRFSLFNVSRWKDVEGEPSPRPACCGIVPILWQGNFDKINAAIEEELYNLEQNGSAAAPGFMKPEGIVIFHTAANVGFKKTIEKDEIPKSLR